MLLYVSDAVASWLTKWATNDILLRPDKQIQMRKKFEKPFSAETKKMKKSPLFSSAFLKMGLDSPENFCQVLNFKLLKGSSDYLNISEQKKQFIEMNVKKYYFYSLLPFVQH